MTYKNFIQNIINTRGQWNIPDGECYEIHHIIPRCMGGEPKRYSRKSMHKNLIWLLPDEHYQAHKLLALENPDNEKLIYAFYTMSHLYNNKGLYNVTNEEYALAKELQYKNGPWNKGMEMSNEFCYNISQAHLGLKYPNRKRIKLSEDHKDNISKSCKEVFDNNRLKYDGYAFSPEARKNISNAAKGKPKKKFTCPICNRIIGCKSNFDRHLAAHNK